VRAGERVSQVQDGRCQAVTEMDIKLCMHGQRRRTREALSIAMVFRWLFPREERLVRPFFSDTAFGDAQTGDFAVLHHDLPFRIVSDILLMCDNNDCGFCFFMEFLE